MLCLIVLGLLATASAWPAYPGCGVSSVRDQGADRGYSRIVGGWEVEPHEYPHTTTIRTQTGSYFCGGSIISDNKVITAAHCTENRKEPNLRVGMGEHDRGTGPEYVLSEVLVLHQHEDYNSQTIQHDISVLEVPTIELNFARWPLCPSSQDTNAEGYDGVILHTTGWGATTEGGSVSDVLMAVDMPGVGLAACAESEALDPSWLMDGMMCAGWEAGGKDTCQGDSGGPLGHFNNGAYELVGIVSWGVGCARPATPGVYADAVYYKDWVAQFF